MTDTPYLTDAEDSIAYIRLVNRAALPAEIRDKTEGMDQIYSIHDAQGHVLALVDDRDKAFVVARMNEMQPVSVH
ncbi:MAG: DUF1150 family protein [Pseudomonadota bacterium]